MIQVRVVEILLFIAFDRAHRVRLSVKVNEVKEDK